MSEAIIKHTISDLEIISAAIAKSNLFGIKTVEQAMVLCLLSQAEGRHPALAARDYNIIQGKPSKTSEAMLRDYLENGGKVEWHALTDEIADATFSHPSGGTVRITWDLERAKRAGLSGKDNWKKHTRQMLRARVVSEGVRTVCPMATSGFYVPEEVQDFEKPALRNISPIKETMKNTVVHVEPDYLPGDEPTILGFTEKEILRAAGKKDLHDSTADAIFSEIESKRSIAKQLVQRVAETGPNPISVDEAMRFLTNAEAATFSHLDKVKNVAKLEEVITKAQAWLTEDTKRKEKK